MEFKAQAKNVRISPRKARQVAAVVKKFRPTVAGEKLNFLGKGAAKLIFQVLKSALANATQNEKVKEEDLKVKNILIDEGTRMKRRDKHHRISRDSGIIAKPTSHITVILES